MVPLASLAHTGRRPYPVLVGVVAKLAQIARLATLHKGVASRTNEQARPVKSPT